MRKASIARILADISIAPNTTGLPGIAALRTIVGAMLTVGLILAVLALIVAAVMWGFGENSSNPHMAQRGKSGVVVACGAAVSMSDTPTLPMVVDRMLSPDTDADPRLAEDGRLAGHALRRLVFGDLSGLFDGPSTTVFDPRLPMISLDLSRVAESAALLSVLMTCASAWMEAALQDPDGGQRWVVYDEAWRLMSHPALLRRMDAQWRMSRHYGISNLLIFHRLGDLETAGDQGSALRALASSLLANAEVRIVYRQEPDQLSATATALGLTGTEQFLLPQLGTGQGLWRIGRHSFVVQHQLAAEELAAFDTTQRMRLTPAVSASGPG